MKNLNLNRIKSVILEFPFVLLSALCFYLYIYYIIEYDDNEYESLVFIFSTAIPLFFGLKILSTKIGNVWLLRLLGIFLLGVYYYILPSSLDEYTEITAYIVIPVYLLVHLFVAVAKNLWGKLSQHAFWNYNVNFFKNITTSIIFTGVLIAGILSIIYTCDELFELDISGNLYLKVCYFILVLGNTIIFLLFTYRDEYEVKQQQTFPIVIKFFTQFVLISIMFLYTFVLYVYSLKILINWELPQGWLSYGILSYSVVGILAILLVYPLRNESKKSWVRWFYQLFFYSLIPLIILLFVAIFTRLLEYGFTEPRYYVLALAIWLSICTLYFIFIKKASISFIPKSLMLTIIIALIFPLINAFSVSIRSQEQGLKKLLIENNLLKNGKIDYSEVVESRVLQEINNKYQFLAKRIPTTEFLQYLDEKQRKKIVEESYYNFLNVEDFKQVINENNEVLEENKFLLLKSKNKTTYINSGSYIYRPEAYSNSPLYLNNDTVILYSSRDIFNLTLNDKETHDFVPELKEFIDHYRKEYATNETYQTSVDSLVFEANLKKYNFRVFLESLQQFGNKEIKANVNYIIIQEKK